MSFGSVGRETTRTRRDDPHRRGQHQLDRSASVLGGRGASGACEPARPHPIIPGSGSASVVPESAHPHSSAVLRSRSESSAPAHHGDGCRRCMRDGVRESECVPGLSLRRLGGLEATVITTASACVSDDWWLQPRDDAPTTLCRLLSRSRTLPPSTVPHCTVLSQLVVRLSCLCAA
jgi:hypothetical protein